MTEKIELWIVIVLCVAFLLISGYWMWKRRRQEMMLDKLEGKEWIEISTITATLIFALFDNISGLFEKGYN